MKKILVTGGREYGKTKGEREALWHTLRDQVEPHDKYFGYVVIIHGGCKRRVILDGYYQYIGADYLAGEWAKLCGYRCEEYPADWEEYGKAAGPIRNQQMIDEGKPDLAIVCPGGKGTADMVARLKKAGIPIVEVKL